MAIKKEYLVKGVQIGVAVAGILFGTDYMVKKETAPMKEKMASMEQKLQPPVLNVQHTCITPKPDPIDVTVELKPSEKK